MSGVVRAEAIVQVENLSASTIFFFYCWHRKMKNKWVDKNKTTEWTGLISSENNYGHNNNNNNNNVN